MTEKDTEKTKLENTLLDIVEGIKKGIEYNRIKTEKVSEMLSLAIQYQLKYDDRRFLIKLFFTKTGKTTLYASLGLKNYFLEYGVIFEYNVRKDKLVIAGNLSDITDTFSDWKKLENERKKQELEKLTEKEKLQKSFAGRFSKLTEKQKKILIELLK